MYELERGYSVNEKLRVRKIGFIGGGVMAEALIGGVLKAGVCRPESIMVSDVSAERLKHLSAAYGVGTDQDNLKIVSRSDFLVIAVKPQVISEVLREIGHSVHENVIVVSIAAGVKIATLAQSVKARLVRAMPNVCATVGEGITAFAPTPKVDADDRLVVEAVFSSVGKTLWLDESRMDAVTAISGSGPAYLFLVMEAMIQAGVENGLSLEQARLLVFQTVRGAAVMAMGGEHPAVLREKVTSPGGTTAAALHELEAHGVRGAILAAVAAAAERARELG